MNFLSKVRGAYDAFLEPNLPLILLIYMNKIGGKLRISWKAFYIYLVTIQDSKSLNIIIYFLTIKEYTVKKIYPIAALKQSNVFGLNVHSFN